MVSFARVATFAALLCGLVASSSAATYWKYGISGRKCDGMAKYQVEFYMAWTPARFGKSVPASAHISPLTAMTHKSRFSPFAEYCTATYPVEVVAESGNNKPLIWAMNRMTNVVGNVVGLSTPGKAVGPTRVTVMADATRGFTQLSAITMLAPTPDWVAMENNIKLCRWGRWANLIHGPIYGYDAGTETRPGVNTRPKQNIYQLQAPRYPTYEKPVGWYNIKMVTGPMKKMPMKPGKTPKKMPGKSPIKKPTLY